MKVLHVSVLMKYTYTVHVSFHQNLTRFLNEKHGVIIYWATKETLRLYIHILFETKI